MEKLKNILIHNLVMLIFIISTTGCHSFQSDDEGYIYPLKLSECKRFLTDQKDKPFFWSGDAAWSLIIQLNREEVDYYLDDRKQKGFTVILVNLIDHKFGGNAPADFYNEPPFHDKPFVSPNESYFSHADYVIQAAAQRGILVLLCPLYLGWEYGDEGWGEDVEELGVCVLFHDFDSFEGSSKIAARSSLMWDSKLW